MIGIVDYGMGNLGSVANAIDYLGHSARLVTRPEDIFEFSHLILPGVGSYAAAMTNLARRDLIASMRDHIAKGKPFLGICLGMQLLSTTGTEHGTMPGLDAIPGEVVPLKAGPDLAIPHVGWNNVDLMRTHAIFAGIKTHIDFYFVHSFHFRATDSAHVLGVTPYGFDFTSCVARNNVVGVQFHPEKSQESGLKLIGNFCEWDGQC
jgi:imidazole glycerol-phosphate synthase subunit HisH